MATMGRHPLSRPRLAVSGKRLLGLQALVALYSLTGVLSKTAADGLKHGLFSFAVMLPAAGMVLVLAIYAFFWQRAIKGVPLTVAYANKGLTLLWALPWSYFIFGEAITLQKLLGILVILLGVGLAVSHE